MDHFLAFIENSDLSERIRGSESLLGFPGIITLHAVGMAFLAGGSAAIDLRILGLGAGQLDQLEVRGRDRSRRRSASA